MPNLSEPWLILDHNFHDFLPTFKSVVKGNFQNDSYLLIGVSDNKCILLSYDKALYDLIKQELNESCKILDTNKARIMVAGNVTGCCYGNTGLLS